jgi:hypothetical protein
VSIESNKQDFEQALATMSEHIQALDACVDVHIMDALKSVINEYETHFQSDIEDLIDECIELKEIGRAHV